MIHYSCTTTFQYTKHLTNLDPHCLKMNVLLALASHEVLFVYIQSVIHSHTVKLWSIPIESMWREKGTKFSHKPWVRNSDFNDLGEKRQKAKYGP